MSIPVLRFLSGYRISLKPDEIGQASSIKCKTIYEQFLPCERVTAWARSIRGSLKRCNIFSIWIFCE